MIFTVRYKCHLFKVTLFCTYHRQIMNSIFISITSIWHNICTQCVQKVYLDCKFDLFPSSDSECSEFYMWIRGTDFISLSTIVRLDFEPISTMSYLFVFSCYSNIFD
jgi:hypothetical protein